MPPNGYVITLARRPDRLQAFQAAVSRTGLVIDPFCAVDGRELDIVPFTPRLGEWYREFSSDAAIRGMLGCKFSHEAVWEKIAGHPDGLYFVFEDDARLLHPGFAARVLDALRRTPVDADLVWLNDFDAAAPIRFWRRVATRLDRETGRLRAGSRVSRGSARVRVGLGAIGFRRWAPLAYTTAEAYLIRPAYATRLLAYTRRWLDAIDGQMKSAVENIGGTAYQVRPGLFTQDAALGTDIQLGR